MISKCLIVVAFAVLGVCSQPIFNSNSQSSGCTSGKENFGTQIPVTHIRTSIFENPTVEIPAYSFPTTLSEACHCMKTIVKPQLRKEIITVPTVDRIVQTVCTPHFETIECGERSAQNSKIGSAERSGNSGLQGSNSNNFNSGSLIGGNFGNTGASFGGQTGSQGSGQIGSVFGGSQGSGSGQIGSVFGGSQGSLFSCNTNSQSQNQKPSSISGLFGGNSGSVLGATSGSLLGGNSGSHTGGQTEIPSFTGSNKQESESLNSLFENYFKNQNVCHHNF